MHKQLLITACIASLLVGYAWANEEFIGDDAYSQLVQQGIKEKFPQVDTEVEDYLLSIDSFDGKLVDLLREIGDKFTRIYNKNEEGFYARYVELCVEVTQQAAKQTSSIPLSAEALKLIECDYTTFIEQKLLAYKKAAIILALEQAGRLVEQANTVYMQELYEAAQKLHQTMNRFRAKIDEAAQNFRFTEDAYDGSKS